MQTIAERLKWLISNWLPERKRFVTLTQVSHIPADHWKNFWHGRQRPTAEMIETIGRLAPEYSEWLLTGTTSSRKQVDPTAAQSKAKPETEIPQYQQAMWESFYAINQLGKPFGTRLSASEREQYREWLLLNRIGQAK